MISTYRTYMACRASAPAPASWTHWKQARGFCVESRLPSHPCVLSRCVPHVRRCCPASILLGPPSAAGPPRLLRVGSHRAPAEVSRCRGRACLEGLGKAWGAEPGRRTWWRRKRGQLAARGNTEGLQKWASVGAVAGRGRPLHCLCMACLTCLAIRRCQPAHLPAFRALSLKGWRRCFLQADAGRPCCRLQAALLPPCTLASIMTGILAHWRRWSTLAECWCRWVLPRDWLKEREREKKPAGVGEEGTGDLAPPTAAPLQPLSQQAWLLPSCLRSQLSAPPAPRLGAAPCLCSHAGSAIAFAGHHGLGKARRRPAADSPPGCLL